MKKFGCFISLISIFFVILFTFAQCQAEDVEQVIKGEGGSVKISLPAYLERRDDLAAGDTTIFKRNEPFGLLGVSIMPLREPPSVDINSESYQRQYLANVKQSIFDLEGSFEENNDFFNAPTLICDKEVKTKTGVVRKHRDVHFLKDGRYFDITFGCDKDHFDEQWKDMEARIRKMEFLK